MQENKETKKTETSPQVLSLFIGGAVNKTGQNQETVLCLKECDQPCFHQCDNCYTVCDCLSCYK